MKISDLNFRTITEADNAPDLACDYCGEEKEGEGQQCATVKIAAGHSLTVIICSDKCLYDWKREKYSDLALGQHINKLRKQHRMQAIKKMGK